MEPIQLDMVADDTLLKALTPAGLDFYTILQGQYLRGRAKLDHLSLREQHRGAGVLWSDFSRKVTTLSAWAKGRGGYVLDA